MRKKLLLIICLVLASLSLAMAAEPDSKDLLSGIRINKYEIKSLVPRGLTSVKGTIKVNVTCDVPRMVISGINGVVYTKNGSAFVRGSADEIVLEKGTHDVLITGYGSLESFSALASLIMSGASLNPADYTADIYASIRTDNKPARRLSYKNISLGMLRK
ncbi:MAG: hypothetical protein MJY72_02080 [Bacteroidales bacterium]|nr:hypothetical protein [Bacteroidales bacterium]